MIKKTIVTFMVGLVIAASTISVKADTYDLVEFDGRNSPKVESADVADVGDEEIIEGMDVKQNPLIGNWGEDNPISTLSILDDRGLTFLSNVETAPFCKIVMLRMGIDKDGDGISEYYSDRTGFLVGPGIALTAGHCLLSKQYTIVSVEGYTKWNGNNKYGSKAMAKSWYVPKSYYENYDEQGDFDWNYDWGIVEFDCNLAEKVGWMGIGYSADDIVDKNITVSGYPGDSKYQGHQCCSKGVMTSLSEYRFMHTANTLPGHSGSPAFDSDGVVWGIHAYGQSSLTNNLNSGTRIDINLYGILKQKIYDDINKYY